MDSICARRILFSLGQAMFGIGYFEMVLIALVLLIVGTPIVIGLSIAAGVFSRRKQ